MTDEHEATYGLVMPFIVCGDDGPYDSGSFVGGAWFGQIMAELGQLARTPVVMTVTVDYTVPTELVPQLELVAMHHGFTMKAEPWEEHPDEHTFVTFTRSQPEQIPVIAEDPDDH